MRKARGPQLKSVLFRELIINYENHCAAFEIPPIDSVVACLMSAKDDPSKQKLLLIRGFNLHCHFAFEAVFRRFFERSTNPGYGRAHVTRQLSSTSGDFW